MKSGTTALKVLEAGVEAGLGPEGLGDCSAAHFAEVVVVQAAGGKGGRIDE